MKKALEQLLTSGIKTDHKHNIGVELEHFILDNDNNAVSYFGIRGIEDILKDHMVQYQDTNAYIEDGHLLGFSTNHFNVSLEPGAQYEVSINYTDNIDEIKNYYEEFCNGLLPILNNYSYHLCNEGYQPKTEPEAIALLPKKRYEYMDKYLKTKDHGYIRMMRASAALQISIDYFSEDDFVKKMRVASLVTPIIQLIMGNTPSLDTNATPKYLKRADVWRHVDNDRCGIVPQLFSDTFSFSSYAECITKLPLIVREMNGMVDFVGDASAKDVYSKENFGEAEARHVSSMFFFDVRAKNYIEIRGADSVGKDMMLSYAAFIKGLMYSDEFIDWANTFILENNIIETSLEEYRSSIMDNGWCSDFCGLSSGNFAKKLFAFAEERLPENEIEYLKPITSINM